MLMVAPLPASSAYRGTRSMSIKGDLPGLSNLCCGIIGSYQYSTSLSAISEAKPAAGRPAIVATRMIREELRLKAMRLNGVRSEERRVGKECRCGRWA